jgi:tripartite-type tricarboxylate transporter receptor subunit TctC
VTALPLHQSGRLRIIATTGARRLVVTPDIPTVGESLPGFEWDSWTGFLAPTGTPPAVISRVHAESVRITKLPETNERLPGFEWIGSTPEAFSEHIKTNIARIGKVVREAGIKGE